jgi:hypothetical protein
MRAFFAILCVLISGGTALANEQPKYDVVWQFEGFELRRYAPYIVAETTVSGDFDDVGDEAFRILFRYISGENRKQTKIEMTAPVNQTPTEEPGEKISMTAPVVQTPVGQGKDSYVFSFIMPSKYTLDTLPEPEDPRIRLRPIGTRLMAARAYSGTWSEKRYRENETALLEALKAEGIQPIGEPIFARYNSPFTLWFMRTNEVLVEVKGTKDPS